MLSTAAERLAKVNNVDTLLGDLVVIVRLHQNLLFILIIQPHALSEVVSNAQEVATAALAIFSSKIN